MIIDNVFVKTFITQIIDKYNFTITEDTPQEVSIAVDPELLGYIFENLIQEYDAEQLAKKSEKKKKAKKDNQRSKGGIFYTPKIEVDFMCRQVLIERLAKDPALHDNKKDLYELFYPEQGGALEQKSWSFSLTQIHSIFERLESLTVVDPACGSGAFLVGMMQVIIDVENTLLESNVEKIRNSTNDTLKTYLRTKFDIFQRKKQLIRSTLHGVDIKAWAVEIAKLRLWLSMIVDVDPELFQKNTTKTEPLLPSFAFKIVQGDSLVNRIGHGLIPLDYRRSLEINKNTRDKIAQIANLKRDFYDNRIKDEYQVWHEEFQIFQEILLNRIRHLKGERTKLNDLLHKEDGSGFFGEKQKAFSDTQRRKMTKQATELSSEIETITSQLNQLSNKKKSPFSWSVSFSDILLGKGWFDILVGNPPYVRQEEIEDPTGQIKDKKIYKTLCQKDMIAQDRWESVKRIARGELDVGGRSDLYLYFYFRGLALINESWMFTFITSNSWLDVDFGSSLQEFLIRYCPRWKVIDNQVQRSFASASINTVMVFIDKPIISTDMMQGQAQFINFGAKYEDALWSEVLSEVDPEVPTHETLGKKIITTGEVSFSKRSDDLLRVIDISAEDLWKDGSDSHCEDDTRSEEDMAISWLLDREYSGNKLGGKYLYAPDIFYTIMDKWWKDIISLKSIAKVSRWLTTGSN